MFQRFHALKERREGGFTLIELLVVILIIAILAAIAIPVFLSQREKGWEGQAQSALKNAATAMESYATGNGGDYSDATLALLEAEGFNNNADDFPVTVESADSDGYCLQVNHATLDDNWSFKSSQGEPVKENCAAA